MISDTPFHFFNIAPMTIGEEQQLAEELIEYTARTGNRDVLYSMTMHPEGLPATKKADIYIDSYRKLRQALTGSDVQLGVLLQTTMGHWPRTDKNEENWTRTVNIQGHEDRYCSLDENFRNYVRYFVTALAKEKPCLIMGDDDIRSFSPYAECFCPLHVAEFNRRTGKNFTSEELRQAVYKSQEGDEIFNAFLKLQRDTVNGLAKLIRETIDAVDPAIPGACCMPGWEYRFVGETAKIIAAKGQKPIMRICNADYMENGPKTDFPEVVLRAMALRELHKDIPVLLDESDSCPHTLYSRCAIGMHAKLCTSIMSGLTGAKLWYVNGHRMGYPIHRNYTDVLAENRGMYQQLTREVATTSQIGVIQPGHYRYEHWNFTENAQYEYPVEFEKNWTRDIVARYGIPFQCRFDLDSNEVYMLSTPHAIARYSDEELQALMKCKVLIDGDAAIELCKRGFGKYIGVNAEEKTFLFNCEYDCATKQFLPAERTHVPYLTALSPNVKVLSKLAYRPFAGSTDCRDVAPAATLFENECGGRIAVVTYNVNYFFARCNEMRKDWLTGILDRLYGAPMPYCVENYQDIILIARKYRDGSALLAAVNSNYDPVKVLNIRCSTQPTRVQLMDCNGAWNDVDAFSFKGNSLAVKTDMPCYGVVILKIS